jgi:hypothetical protein
LNCTFFKDAHAYFLILPLFILFLFIYKIQLPHIGGLN